MNIKEKVKMLLRNKLFKVVLIMTVIIFIGMVIFLTSSAFSAANLVGSSRVGSSTHSAGENDLKPPECAGIVLTNIVVCSGGNTCNGSQGDDLILGTEDGETISGKKGTDCIVGGGGDDTIKGGNGDDVCIGGPGDDTFNNCGHIYP